MAEKRSTTKKNTRKKGGSKKKKPMISNVVITDLSKIPEPRATVAVTEEQYEKIVRLLWEGTPGPSPQIRANPQCSLALQIEANTGIRVSDVMNLRLSSFVRDGGRYRFNMYEQKTGKLRTFLVPDPVYRMIDRYAKVNGIGHDEKLFSISIRDLQQRLAAAVDYLGYNMDGPSHISTHSFRKRFATQAYLISGDIEVPRLLLNHSSQSVTQAYISYSTIRVERTLEKVVNIVASY
jgi:integrase